MAEALLGSGASDTEATGDALAGGWDIVAVVAPIPHPACDRPIAASGIAAGLVIGSEAGEAAAGLAAASAAAPNAIGVNGERALRMSEALPRHCLCFGSQTGLPAA